MSLLANLFSYMGREKKRKEQKRKCGTEKKWWATLSYSSSPFFSPYILHCSNPGNGRREGWRMKLNGDTDVGFPPLSYFKSSPPLTWWMDQSFVPLYFLQIEYKTRTSICLKRGRTSSECSLCIVIFPHSCVNRRLQFNLCELPSLTLHCLCLGPVPYRWQAEEVG